MSSNATSDPSFPPTTSSIPTTFPPTTDTPTTSPPPTTESPPTTSDTTTPPPPPTTETTTTPPTTTTTTVSTTPSTTVVTSSTTVVSTTIITTETTVTVPPTTSTPPPTTVVTTTVYTDPTTTESSTTTRSPSPTGTVITPTGQNSGGLSTPGTIAIAVIIPVVVVALLLVLGFFLWRKRKARKLAEEQRKNEMAEYGFNPNNDPSLFPVTAAYTDGHSEANDDTSGYRGWGTTNSTARRPSTTLGSNGRGAVMGMGLSESGSQPSGYGPSPPVNGAQQEAQPSDPLMGHQEHTDGVAALGGAAAVKNNRNSQADIQRGVSNASSSYSRGPPHSESSAEVPYGSPQYHEDVPYHVYQDGTTQGSYGDGGYGPDNPVIRDVSARRNTKIERAPTFPQTQGGISQNF